MKTKPATIRDVARASGVSSATVSYVLNDGPRRVDPSTRARVVAAMERLQYHPNTMARGLNRKRLNSLGVMFPQPNPLLVVDSYFSAILNGIIQVATERRQNVTLYTSPEWQDSARLPALRDRRVDGLLLIAPLTDSPIVPSLKDLGVPFVLIDRLSEDPGVASVGIDNVAAACRVVAYLRTLGHRRIALLGGQPNSPSTAPRREGYRQALMEGGLPLDPDLLLEGAYTQEWGRVGMARLLALPDPPTAVFAGGDGIALGAYQACAAAGVAVPAQMSVVGFDDAEFVRHLNPPLTTVRHPLTPLGAAAATMLLDRLDTGARMAAPVILPTDLIVRESTAVPRTLPVGCA